jgi:hypothetical protein
MGLGMGGGGTEKKQRSQDGVLEPVKKGMEEVGVSKRRTEVEVKMATPCGRKRGEMPTRE